MRSNRLLTTRDEAQQRAALRAGVLEYGRVLRWSTRATIAFTEQLARRPWKRLTRDQLSAVAEELHAMVWAFEFRHHAPQPSLFDPAMAPLSPEDRHALRN